jgi:hypothetical protein
MISKGGSIGGGIGGMSSLKDEEERVYWLAIGSWRRRQLDRQFLQRDEWYVFAAICI